jgi:hypothetical protein
MTYNQQLMLMKLTKKMYVTLLYGRLQSPEIHHGQHHGEQVAQVGTWSVLQWHMHTLGKALIFTVAD